MTTILRDLRHALRSARRQPGVTAVIVLTLAVGIGASTAIFTLFTELYWASVRVPEPESLFWLRSGTREEPDGPTSFPDFLDYRESLGDLGDAAAWAGFGAILGLPGRGGGDAETTYGVGLAVTQPYFDLLGARFALGRGFLPAEDRTDGPPVAVVHHSFWSRYLGADPEAVGRTIRVNGKALTLVGVLPQSFQGTSVVFPIYVPAHRFDDVSPLPALADRDARRFYCLLRTRDAVPRAAVEARLATVAAALDREHPWPRDERRSLSLLDVEGDGRNPETGELMLAGAVGLLLLLACANVANLLLARAAGRRREMAVLAAIGASRRRIAARLLTESVLLAVAGGVLGLAVARWIVAVMKRYLEVRPFGLASWGEGTEWMRVDDRVLLFALAVSLLTGCLFGLAPILYAARTDLVSALKSGAAESRPGRRFGARQALVVAQVVISTVLVLVAALLVRGLENLKGRDLGFETEHMLLAAVSTVPARTGTPETRRDAQRELYELARRRLAALPGVKAAALTTDPPGGGFNRLTRLELAQRPGDDLQAAHMSVGPSYFATFGIPLLQGRPFDDGDRSGAPGAAIVTRAFVARHWPDGEALGRELRLPELTVDAADGRFVVVGVAADTAHYSRRDEPSPLVYLPLAQHLRGSRALAVARTTGPPAQAMRSARETLATAHPDLALVDLDTYERLVAFDLSQERLYSAVAALFSLFGLGLACLGIYSVMDCSVTWRMREMGIRTALGATVRDLVRRVLGEAFTLLAAGILVGVAAALALARLLSSLLYGVAPHDPGTFVALPLLLAAVGLAAAWRPAWRAGRVDPKTVLQEE